MTASDAWRWVRTAPAERATLPAAGVFWAAADILHAEHISALEVGVPVAMAACVTYGWGARRKRDHSQDQADARARYSRQAAVAMAALGGWAAAAAQYGPMAGPGRALSVAYLAGTFGGYWWLRNHEVVRGAREWRRAKIDWLARSGEYGLAQTHLLDYEHTWLGESMLVNVKDTGRRASSYVRGSDLAERIAEVEDLPESRVRITSGGRAGRIKIEIRYKDPWQKPLNHPVLDPVDGLELPVPCTVHDPLTVGYSPDNGNPLDVTLWDKTGAKCILIVGMKGAGKSALLSCIRERITAAEDALLWDVNVSGKASEDDDWAPVCDLTAIGAQEKQRALRMLLCARYLIELRSSVRRKTRDFVPDHLNPLVVMMIDEIDELLKGNDELTARLKKELEHVLSKGRSEAVAVLVAGQRGTQAWFGGANIKPHFDTIIVGKVNRESEVRNAIAEYADLVPSMAVYGEGQPGVWAIVNFGLTPMVGRNFKLTEPDDLQRLARERAMDQPELEPAAVDHLGDHYRSLKEGQAVAHGPVAHDEWATAEAGSGGPGGPSDGPGRTATAVLDRDGTSLEKLGQAVNEALPRDLQAALRRMDDRAADTRRIAAEADAIERGLPDADPARMAEAARQRWDRGAEETGPLPPEIRDQLIEMIKDGASVRKIAVAFGQKVWTVRKWLNRLRFEGVIACYGEKRGARWMLVSEAEAQGLRPAGDPAPDPPADGPQE